MARISNPNYQPPRYNLLIGHRHRLYHTHDTTCVGQNFTESLYGGERKNITCQGMTRDISINWGCKQHTPWKYELQAPRTGGSGRLWAMVPTSLGKNMARDAVVFFCIISQTHDGFGRVSDSLVNKLLLTICNLWSIIYLRIYHHQPRVLSTFLKMASISRSFILGFPAFSSTFTSLMSSLPSEFKSNSCDFRTGQWIGWWEILLV